MLTFYMNASEHPNISSCIQKDHSAQPILENMELDYGENTPMFSGH